jgi:exodeoxyribonuclease VII small subunit
MDILTDCATMPGKTKTVKNTAGTNPDQQPEDSQTFESAMEELEGIVDRLESDELTLDGALSSFEQGIRLLRTCDAHLNQVRGKISELVKGENGEFVQKVLGTSLESFLSEDNEDD